MLTIVFLGLSVHVLVCLHTPLCLVIWFGFIIVMTKRHLVV